MPIIISRLRACPLVPLEKYFRHTKYFFLDIKTIYASYTPADKNPFKRFWYRLVIKFMEHAFSESGLRGPDDMPLEFISDSMWSHLAGIPEVVKPALKSFNL